MKKNVKDDLFEKFAKEEKEFFSKQFFSPVLRGRPILIRLAGMIQTLHVTKPKNYEGWGVFSPANYRECHKVRDPNLSEKEQYYKLFPRFRLILCRRQEKSWLAVTAYQADSRFKVTGMIPIHLVEDAQLFDVITARWDTSTFWYEGPDSGRSPRTAVYLRESLNKLLEPKDLDCSGLTQEERDAYLLAYGPALEADIEAKRDKNEDRIKAALKHAGAQYQGYIERGDSYTIEYTVGSERHRSVVKKDNLAVESAGICLSGGDRAFDLQSLVGVIREGQERRRIVRVGDNVNYGNDSDYDDDW